ncbi:hypothetical protein Bca52824_022930 [Brassica carinata]|uniref:Ubiquitin-like protease family profile domain-containing protein n=1 Tax=Brassica carinata TaxID=52824 RepID=A0A8X7VGW0_BRACI|nr:hypothetical protein Bca52824_022930 [Brassica carinata]
MDAMDLMLIVSSHTRLNFSPPSLIFDGTINNFFVCSSSDDYFYPYISWTGNYDVVESEHFCRDDEVEDDRITVLKELIRSEHDFSENVWEFEETLEDSLELDDEEAVNVEAHENVEAAESDESFQTPRGSKNLGATSKKGKKRLPDRGMEKMKHKVLSSGSKPAPFNEDMKAFVTQLFEQNFSAMEHRLQKQMAETFEQMKSELKNTRNEASVEVEHGEPPSPTKTSTSQQPSLRRSTRREASQSRVDVNFTQEDASFRGISTQGVEGLSQASYVPNFDPSQTNKEDDWWTPMTSVRGSKAKPSKDNTAPPPSQWKKWSRVQGKRLQLSDTPLPQDGSPQSSLYYFSEESWNRFTECSMNPIPFQIGPSLLNLTVASRIEMDAYMFIWRVNTTLKRWAPTRVAFMSAMFCLQLDAAFKVFNPDKKSYELPDFLLGYGRGELPSHERTDQVWGVDVDHLYFPLFVNDNHWIAVCVNIIEKKVEVYDCSGGKNRQYVEKFSAMIPRIVKAIAPPERQKKLHLSVYSIVDVPMKKRLNKSCCDCGAYALKHLECCLLGLDVSLVDDEIIQGCRQKIGVDLWEAAHDPIFAEVMTRYVPSSWERSEVFDLEED